MKNINKKQRTIMKAFGTFLFAVALILILDLAFNGGKVKIDKKFVGTWMIGYKFYSGEEEKDELYTFVQELHLVQDGTFYTKEIRTPDNGNDNFVSGTYVMDGEKIILNYTQQGVKKSNTLILSDNKLCLSADCQKYYTKDKVNKYFSMYNATVTTSEE